MDPFDYDYDYDSDYDSDYDTSWSRSHDGLGNIFHENDKLWIYGLMLEFTALAVWMW